MKNLLPLLSNFSLSLSKILKKYDNYLVKSEFLIFRFIQQKLGIPKFSEYEKLQTEKADLQSKYDKLLKVHTDVCKEVL